ncbi:MAG: MFS transporter [Actinomycetota bacterium]
MTADDEPRDDEPGADDSPTTTSVERPWAALSALLVGLSIIIIDASVVNVLLPDMVTDLGLSQTDAQWINSIYSLVFAALLITVGLFADRYGRRRLFLLGIVVFVLGSLGSASAQGAEVLIAARAVQAIGGSMMLPSSIAVINVLFTGPKRAAAFGLWGAVFGGAAALGPLLGGFLAEDYSWRWAFLINLPVGLVAGLMVWRFVPESTGPQGRGFDPLGVVLSISGLGLIVFALIEGQTYGWWTAIDDFDVGPINLDAGGLSIIPLALGLGVALLVVLVVWQAWRARRGRSTLIELSLFRVRRYAYGNVVALVVSLGEFGILFTIPLWIQSVHGFDPLTTGTILTALAVGTLGAGGAARHVAAALGATNVVRLGMTLEVVGIVGIGLTLGVDRSPWWLTIPLVVYGLGVGFSTAQLTNVVLGDVEPALSGEASAMTSTFRQVGSALGAAALGAILFGLLGSNLDAALADEPGLTDAQRTQIVDEVRGSAGQAIQQLDQVDGLEPEAQDAKVAYTDAARSASWAAAAFVALGLLVSFGLPRDRDPPM